MSGPDFEQRVLSTLGTISNTLADVHAKVIEHDVTLRHHGRAIERLEETDEISEQHQIEELRSKVRRDSERAAAAGIKLKTGVLLAVGVVVINAAMTGIAHAILGH